MTRNTAAYEPGYLARFTATITSMVPAFDPATNPIGHALADELFYPVTEAMGIPVVPEIVVPVTTVLPVIPALPAAKPAVSWPELAIEARARALSERARALAEHAAEHPTPLDGNGIFGDLVELPVAVSEVEWFGATTEPDEDIEDVEEQVRIAG